MSGNVSITFQNNDDARPIVAAILEDNPAAEASNLPGIVTIKCPERLVVKRESVEERIGRDWDPQELHLTLVTLAGSLDEDDDEFVLHWG